MRLRCVLLLGALAALACGVAPSEARAQSFGAELFNTLTPASGGMAGTSIARPQDNVSAINGNAASLTQYHGTQFTVGGAWAGSTFDLTQTGRIPVGSPTPLITPFSAKSSAPGVAVPSVAVSQDISALGLPVTLGLGVVASAGGGTSFRLPQANGTNFAMSFLNFGSSAAVQLTDRLSIGTTLFVGTGFVDGPFIGDSTMTAAYGVRGSFGLNYQLTERTNLGCYYQTKEHFRFKDEIRLENPDGTFQVPRDMRLDLPDNVGLGLSNSSLLDGKLLLAADVLYIQWKAAETFSDVYRNQWTLQLGTQYTVNPRCRLRLGYAYGQNPIDPNTGSSLAGVAPPGGFPAIKYLQAQYGVINQHRISAGVGLVDVLPGLDFDTFAGGMFEASQSFGTLTSISVESYWIGLGFTWRFDRGNVERGAWTSI